MTVALEFGRHHMIHPNMCKGGVRGAPPNSDGSHVCSSAVDSNLRNLHARYVDEVHVDWDYYRVPSVSGGLTLAIPRRFVPDTEPGSFKQLSTVQGGLSASS
jgi:hypothetical protein